MPCQQHGAVLCTMTCCQQFPFAGGPCSAHQQLQQVMLSLIMMHFSLMKANSLGDDKKDKQTDMSIELDVSIHPLMSTDHAFFVLTHLDIYIGQHTLLHIMQPSLTNSYALRQGGRQIEKVCRQSAGDKATWVPAQHPAEQPCPFPAVQVQPSMLPDGLRNPL